MKAAGFEFPDGLHYLVEHQVWARLDDDGLATVGITALGIRQSGEIYMCRPKPAGARVEQGRAVAVVELAKAIVSVKSPLTGFVQAVNERLDREPELVHQDPYGEGWIARLKPDDPDGESQALVHGEAVLAAMEHHAWLSRLDAPEGA